MINKKDIMDKIPSNAKPDDKLLISKSIASAFLCCNTNSPAFTDFYDPKSVTLIKGAFSETKDVSITAFGGGENCERRVVCFSPPGVEVDSDEFPIAGLFVDSSKFSTSLTHRDFLGGIIGTGIERGKIGDIFVEDGNAVCFVLDTISDFILYNLKYIGRVKVKVSRWKESESLTAGNSKIIKDTVPSLRADAVCSAAFNVSRNAAADIIKSEKFYVNWEVVSKSSKELKEGDVLSARGFGRAVIKEVCGLSKKGRVVLMIERFS